MPVETEDATGIKGAAPKRIRFPSGFQAQVVSPGGASPDSLARKNHSAEKRKPYQNEQGPGHVPAYIQGQPRYVSFYETRDEFKNIREGRFAWFPLTIKLLFFLEIVDGQNTE